MDRHDFSNRQEVTTRSLSRMLGMRVLLIGVMDDRREFVWDTASELGVTLFAVGTLPPSKVENKTAGYIQYDASDHTKDHHHCDVIVERVTSEFGDVDGCLTLWEFYAPLTALVCARLGKPGIPYHGAFAAVCKSMTMKALFDAVDEKGEQSLQKYASRCYHVKGVADFDNLGISESVTNFDSRNISTKIVEHSDIFQDGEKTDADFDSDSFVYNTQTDQISDAHKESDTKSDNNDFVDDTDTVKISEAADKIHFPAILKIDFGHGSVTTRLARSIEEARQHLQEIQRVQRENVEMSYYLGGGYSQTCIITEFLEGSEHCVDLALFHGELVCVFVSDKGPQIPPDVFKTVVTMPSLLPEDKLESVITAAFECCRALGLDHGVFDVEFMLTKSGPKLLEINPRMGGYCLREFIRQCYNVDLAHLAFMLACDVRPDVTSLKMVALKTAALEGGNFAEFSNQAPVLNRGTFALHESTDGLKAQQNHKSRSFVVSMPKSSCQIAGMYCHPWRHGLALRTTARPDVLAELHKEGEILFIPHESEIKESPHELLFCTLAVKAESFVGARNRLLDVCSRLGLDAGYSVSLRELLDFFSP